MQISEYSIPFIGEESQAPYKQAKVVLLPVPYELTTTYRKGCETGPEAILAATDQLEFYDVELGKEVVFETGVFVHDAIADTRQPHHQLTPDLMVEEVKAKISHLFADGKFVITLGGEHGITAGVVAGYQQVLSEPFTVVQIDAHGDMRHSYHGSIYNHACVMRRVLEMGLPTLPVAIRSICQEEADLIAEKDIPVIWAHEIVQSPGDWIEKAIAQIQTPRVFITIDLDGMDPACMPGVGTPQPGGLDWYQLTAFLRQVFLTHEVIGCDVMELAPLTESVVSEFTAAKLVHKLIGYYSDSK
ncbi:agmatinase [Spirulina subsalsa FACHB-351]|uniref:Agmatinase n=1 Tax=Spirulina subsalsa FACHB-351 TaxID=234711 RepID=A0ABT3L6E9_9CYAN|nr:agmatinase [Spirulina subsalsa]MCW6037085.1 agmatinase [Spirulina subsalsa FACHB-351]